MKQEYNILMRSISCHVSTALYDKPTLFNLVRITVGRHTSKWNLHDTFVQNL